MLLDFVNQFWEALWSRHWNSLRIAVFVGMMYAAYIVVRPNPVRRKK